MATWLERERIRRGQRAMVRQREYQEVKSRSVDGHQADYVASMSENSRRVRGLLERIQSINSDARVLEVGSGAHGLIFFFGSSRPVGVDPLAHEYATLFPWWQREAPTIAALGSALPFPDSAFDIVLCDNVVDHAEHPQAIVTEMARVLTPAGFLYFTVNVHHWIYAAVALLHRAWNAAGVPFEIGPFADHTVHLTPERGRRLFRGLPLAVLVETCNIEEVRAEARKTPTRHAGDKLKRAFFKNAVLEIVARRIP